MPTPKAAATASGRDVVVRRADAAGGEHVGVACPQRVDRGDDLVLLVRDDAHLAQVDAELGAAVGDGADVLVLGSAGKDLVADDEDGGGDAHAGSKASPQAPCKAVRSLPSRAISSSISPRLELRHAGEVVGYRCGLGLERLAGGGEQDRHLPLVARGRARG